MEWRQVVAHTTTQGADLVSEALMRLGAAGTEIVDRGDVPDPDKPGVYWELYDRKLLENMPEDVLVKAWFEENQQVQQLLHSVEAALAELKAACREPALGSLLVESQRVKDEDWAENWKKNYKPFRVGRRLVVKPTWEAYASKPGDLVVELDPGMAFGTGAHETTSMCMELLERRLTPGDRVMDVGAGSGILAIAAAKLGAKEVLAVDIDPEAVKVARENVALNHVEDRVRVIQGDLVKGEAMPCELAVANIVADAICMLVGPVRKHLKARGLLICSGIIREREEDVLRAAGEAGYRVADRLEKGEWVALCLKNGG